MATRKRTVRRTEERALLKLTEARAKLAALEPGGSAAQPRPATSASVVEPLAEGTPCYVCDGPVQIVEHRAEGGLRIVQVRCKHCQRSRELFFRLDERRLN